MALERCLLRNSDTSEIGAKRKWLAHAQNVADDPERTCRLRGSYEARRTGLGMACHCARVGRRHDEVRLGGA